MSIIELGALGEFLGSIGVIATLIYLAAQIRQNTRTSEQGQRIAMAQAYQSRAALIEDAQRQLADSPYLPEIRVKVNESGIGSLSAEELERFRAWNQAGRVRLDNIHYQYEQGLIDDEYYNNSFKNVIRRAAPIWRELGVWSQQEGSRADRSDAPVVRPTFGAAIERILSESEAESEENEQ